VATNNISVTLQKGLAYSYREGKFVAKEVIFQGRCTMHSNAALEYADKQARNGGALE